MSPLSEYVRAAQSKKSLAASANSAGSFSIAALVKAAGF
jgi:hypothetical protein